MHRFARTHTMREDAMAAAEIAMLLIVGTFSHGAVPSVWLFDSQVFACLQCVFMGHLA